MAIKARITQCRHSDGPAKETHRDAHCGYCGQYLSCVSLNGVPHLVLFTGWRFDGRVWRPTQYHRNQRRKDEVLLSNPATPSHDRREARRRIRQNEYGQPGERASRQSKERQSVERAYGPKAARQAAEHLGYSLRIKQMHDWREGPGANAPNLPTHVECPSPGRRMINAIDLDSV